MRTYLVAPLLLWAGCSLFLPVAAPVDAGAVVDAGGIADAGPAEQPSGAYDGLYVVTFSRSGAQLALGTMTVRSGELTGEARALDGSQFTAGGRVAEDGRLIIEELRAPDGASLIATGRIEDRVLDGIYNLNGEDGHFTGSLANGNTEAEPSTDFDGSYELRLRREGEERVADVFFVHKGRFDLSTVTGDGRNLRITGFVTGDGTVVLNSEASELGFAVVGEASIDQDSGTIRGLYRVGDSVGQINGGRSD